MKRTNLIDANKSLATERSLLIPLYVMGFVVGFISLCYIPVMRDRLSPFYGDTFPLYLSPPWAYLLLIPSIIFFVDFVFMVFRKISVSRKSVIRFLIYLLIMLAVLVNSLRYMVITISGT